MYYKLDNYNIKENMKELTFNGKELAETVKNEFNELFVLILFEYPKKSRNQVNNRISAGEKIIIYQ